MLIALKVPIASGFSLFFFFLQDSIQNKFCILINFHGIRRQTWLVLEEETNNANILLITFLFKIKCFKQKVTTTSTTTT